ncbi:MAG: photosystem II stability/assembly factor-like uncharacterized protein [Cyclobacteriaceae bacterium]|jgi:photosystem II stability/assembly factor-like uncharacterized protein
MIISKYKTSDQLILLKRNKMGKTSSAICKFNQCYLLILCASLLLLSCTQENGQKDENRSPDWTRIGPGGGGSTFMPTFSYHSPDNYIIRCDMTGSYFTKDGGQNYSQVNFPNGSSSFAYNPFDPDIMYIGGGGALNKSFNAGKSWKRIFPAETDIVAETFLGDHAGFRVETREGSLYSDIGKYKLIRNVKIDPGDANKIYFSINNFFFYSMDGGEGWNRLELDEHIAFIYTNKSDLKNLVVICSSKGVTQIDKSDWSKSELAFPEKMNPAFSFTGGLLKERGETIIYGLHNDASLRTHGGIAPTSLWVSNDLGSTWEKCLDPTFNNTLSNTPTYSKLGASEYDAGIIYAVSSSYQEKRTDETIAHWYGALKSTDAGKSWNWVWKGGGGSGRYGVRDGADASNQKDSWVQKAFGGEYIRIIDVGVDPYNPDIAILTDWYRTLKTTDGGLTWDEVYGEEQADGNFKSRGVDVTTTYGVHFDPFDKDHLAISYTDIGFHHSNDRGKSWKRSTTGIPFEWHNTCYWMAFDPDVKGKVWSVWSNLHDFPRGKMTRDPRWRKRGKGGVAVSADGGKSWNPKTEGIVFDSPSTSIVLDENSPVGNRTLYVSAYGKGVFKSIDDGQSWSLKNNGISESLAAFELTLLPNGTLFLITSPEPQHQNQEKGREVFMGAVYRSKDGAESWQKLNVGGKVKFPNGIAFDPDKLDRIYLGSWSDIMLSDIVGADIVNRDGENELIDLDGGIFMSEDGGDTWSSIFDKDEYVYDVTVDEHHPGRLYCNTFSRGAYRSDDYGKSWAKLKDYDFHWGHRVIVDNNDPEKVYLTTFGSSVWHGNPITE